jgi:predicted membrane-bound mannosyltransferase
VLFREWRPALGLGAIYIGAGIAVAFDALRWTRHQDGRRLSTVERAMRAVRVTLFASHWLAALAAGWGRVALGPGEMRYEKMAHVGAPPGWRPSPAQP